MQRSTSFRGFITSHFLSVNPPPPPPHTHTHTHRTQVNINTLFRHVEKKKTPHISHTAFTHCQEFIFMMPVSKLKKQALQPSTLCVGISHRELSLNSSFHGLLVPNNWNTIKFFLSSGAFHCGYHSMKSPDDVNHLLSKVFIFEDHAQINLESIKIQIRSKRVKLVQENWDFETYQKNTYSGQNNYTMYTTTEQ